jgi:hypothetical protein
VYAVVRQGADGELFSSPASRDAWARVGTITGSNLAVFGKAAWFGTRTAGTSTYLWATAGGGHWRKYPFSCPAGLGPRGIAAARSWQVAFLCGASEGTYHSAKEVLVSVNGGRTEHLTGQAPVAGDVAGFAMPPSRAAVITIAVVTPGLSYLYRSANGGKTWAEIAVSSLTGGVSFTCLSYVSPGGGLGRDQPAGDPGPPPAAADIGCRPHLACGQVLNRPVPDVPADREPRARSWPAGAERQLPAGQQGGSQAPERARVQAAG